MSWKCCGLVWKVTWVRVDRSSSVAQLWHPARVTSKLPWLSNQEEGVGNMAFLRWLCEFSEMPQVKVRVRGHLGKVRFC